MVGKRIVFSWWRSVSGAAAAKGGSDKHLAAGAVTWLCVGMAAQGGFLQMCDKYQHDLKV